MPFSLRDLTYNSREERLEAERKGRKDVVLMATAIEYGLIAALIAIAIIVAVTAVGTSLWRVFEQANPGSFCGRYFDCPEEQQTADNTANREIPPGTPLITLTTNVSYGNLHEGVSGIRVGCRLMAGGQLLGEGYSHNVLGSAPPQINVSASSPTPTLSGQGERDPALAVARTPASIVIRSVPLSGPIADTSFTYDCGLEVLAQGVWAAPDPSSPLGSPWRPGRPGTTNVSGDADLSEVGS